jgi:hypothetical protein
MNSRLTAAALFLALAFGLAIRADHAEKSGTAYRPPSAGMRAYIDPATGAVTSRPPAAAATRSLPPPRAPDDSRIDAFTEPDGTIGVQFNGQRQATVIATLNRDGSVQTHCVEGTADGPRSHSHIPSDDGHE